MLRREKWTERLTDRIDEGSQVWVLPKELPIKRPRRLSIPLASAPQPEPSIFEKLFKRERGVAQWTSDQMGSVLLSRVPYEIRLIIWRHYFDYGRIHILRRPGKLSYRICMDHYGVAQRTEPPNQPHEEHDHGSCRELARAPGPRSFQNVRLSRRAQWYPHDDLLPLLKTCRLM